MPHPGWGALKVEVVLDSIIKHLSAYEAVCFGLALGMPSILALCRWKANSSRCQTSDKPWSVHLEDDGILCITL